MRNIEDKLKAVCSERTISRFMKFTDEEINVKKETASIFLLFEQLKKKKLIQQDYNEIIFVNLMLANNELYDLKDYMVDLSKVYDNKMLGIFDLINHLDYGEMMDIYNIKSTLRHKKYILYDPNLALEDLLFDKEFLCKIRMVDHHIISKLIQSRQLISIQSNINKKSKRLIALESVKQYLKDYTNELLLNTREISKLTGFPVNSIDRILQKTNERKILEGKIQSNYIIPYDKLPFIIEYLKINHNHKKNSKSK